MKPAPFKYLQPTSLGDAVAALAEHGDEAALLAGGQSLMPLLALRLAAPSVVIDLNGVSELDYLHDDADGLKIGALARHRSVEQIPGLRDRCTMLAEALAVVGHVPIRNRGTVVGSLAHAHPSAEWPALALALSAELDVAGPAGRRTIPADGFFSTYFTTTLADDELVTAVRFVLPAGRRGSCFLELARRHGDFAVVGAGAMLSLLAEGRIEDARIVLIGVGDTPRRVGEAERMLVGESPSDDLVREAAAVVHDAVEPAADIHGSTRFKRSVARTLTRRALTSAWQRARGADHA